jgi:hypothetical protein
METIEMSDDERESRVQGAFAALKGVPHDEKVRILTILALLCGFTLTVGEVPVQTDK